jgi:hypothetical protein
MEILDLFGSNNNSELLTLTVLSNYKNQLIGKLYFDVLGIKHLIPAQI